MTSHSYSPLVFHVLEHVTLDRLSKAVEGLATNTYTITLITNTDRDISGLVRNGDGVEYGVALLPGKTFCSCRDSMFRHSVCKHVALLALQAVRTPIEQPRKPVVHLIWRNGVVLCGEPQPQKLLPWPWPMSVSNPLWYPDVCPQCVTEWQQPGRSIMREAA